MDIVGGIDVKVINVNNGVFLYIIFSVVRMISGIATILNIGFIYGYLTNEWSRTIGTFGIIMLPLTIMLLALSCIIRIVERKCIEKTLAE